MTQQRLEAPLKFFVVGVANTLIGLLAIYLCKWALGFGDMLANICGYMVGLALSFVLNRSWTFRHAGRALPALVRFLVIFALAYVLNLATVFIAIRSFGVNSYLSHAIGNVPYTVFFYFGSRHFAFSSATDCRA
jgi:putative flippase GtrA